MEKELGNFSDDVFKFLKYEIADGKASITGYNDKPIDIVIPSEIEGKPVTSIGKYAFKGCNSLQNITIPDSVTAIGFGAFSNTAYYNNESNWENNVLYIGNHLIRAKECISGDYKVKNGTKAIAVNAFSYCSSLQSITIPDSMTSIGNGIFEGCISLKKITIPDSVINIDGSAFGSCCALQSIKIPNSVTSIGKHAFENCSSIRSITIPDSVTSIGNGAFAGCSSLQSITIPDSVTSIGNSVFFHCKKLSSIAIPCSVTSIANYAFSDCISLKTVNYNGTREQWDKIVIGDGNDAIYTATINNNRGSLIQEGLDIISDVDLEFLKYEINDREASIKGYNGEPVNLTIPNRIKGKPVTSISIQAFSGCYSLQSVTIHESVKVIDRWAFSNCSSLRSITIPDSVTSIGGDIISNTAYYKNESNWDNDVLYIGNRLIKAKKDISGDYTVKNDTKTIAGSAFEGCSSLQSITIPDSVTSIGDSAFKGCKSLQSITIPGSVTSIGDYAFDGCTSLQSITIPDSVTSIGSSAFAICKSLQSITIPDSVTSIGSSAFASCKSLQSITIPDSVTSIGDYAFIGCESLQSITIPGSVTSIARSVFDSCKSLQSITIPDSVTSIARSAFDSCKSLQSITIPDSVTSIGNGAFSGCSKLLSITIPDSVKSIGSNAFSGCSSLQSITIPDSVTSIGDSAFKGCKSLQSITIPGSVTSIGCSAFEYIAYHNDEANWENGVLYIGNHLIKAKNNISGDYTIKNGTKTIAGDAFKYCSILQSITIPDSVISIGEDAFSMCSSLESVNYAGTNEQWNKIDLGFNNVSIRSATINFNQEYFAEKNLDVFSDDDINLLEYKFKGDEVIITGFKGEPVNLAIPAKIEGKLVTSIDKNAFYNCRSLQKIKIPASVTSIDKKAFYNYRAIKEVHISSIETWLNISFSNYDCGNPLCGGAKLYLNNEIVENLIIPDGITEIKDNTFSGCRSLKSITLPYSVTSVGDNAFENCRNLESVIIPDSVTNIGRGAFSGCWSLKKITIPDSVTNISSEVFKDCKSLESITIPDSVTSILWNAFDNTAYYNNESNWEDGVLYIGRHLICVNEDIDYDFTIKNGTKTIAEGAFDLKYSDCDIENITIPDSVTSIEDEVFSGCSSLKGVYISSIEAWLNISFFGPNSNPLCNGAKLYLNNRLVESIVFPDCITEINICAFNGCSSLKSITIPDSVTSIGWNAFDNTAYYNNKSNWEDGVLYNGNHLICAKEDISGNYTIKSSTKIIADFAFSDCNSLQSITIPDTVTSIGIGAFNGSKALQDITIPDSVICISERVFKNCSKLKCITIPDSVISIGDNAFSGCRSLEIVNYAGTQDQWDKIDKSNGNNALSSATINFIV